MKTKLLYPLIILLLISNGILLFLLLEKPHERPKRAGNFLSYRLGLSKEQEEKFEKLNNKHHDIMIGFDDAIGSLKKEMFETISKNEEINASTPYKIGIYEGKKQEEIFRFLAEIRMICSEKQLENFDNIFKEILSSKEPPGGGHRPPPPNKRPGSHMPPPKKY